ncbi:hypothetical protein Sste5346_008517 [Sporothrix stenoceras]|uniref:Uncharacterized protein n=1 Tax=Sporothrix stenoceras TaxID=5173 RepID=A0ABR3YNY7_9PEZI
MGLFDSDDTIRRRQQRKAEAQQQKAQQAQMDAQLAIWKQTIEQHPQQLPFVLSQIQQTIAAGAAAAGVSIPTAPTGGPAAVFANSTRPDPPPQANRPQMPLTPVVLVPDPDGLEDPDHVSIIDANRRQ